MKKVVIILMLVLSTLSINAQTGKANLEDIAPVLFEAVSTNNPLLIDPLLKDTEGDNHDMLLGQVATVHGVLVKQGVNFNVPTASQTETVLFNSEGLEHGIIKYSAVSNGVAYTISARCTKIDNRWFIVSNILPTGQSVN
ncbi:MAG: hypothetical protein M0D57_14105 [Sphingobacteriales bacterium JAD_PAG50586_3]|nr:MAG: hypothetical protein M0D57_14105 [Sphingobacteriales bacterium JAD_PAG50586_3]